MRCARQVHKRSKYAQSAIGLKAKLFQKKRYSEKATMKKTIAMHNEREHKHKAEDNNPEGAVPAYLLDRNQVDYCCLPHAFSTHLFIGRPLADTGSHVRSCA